MLLAQQTAAALQEHGEDSKQYHKALSDAEDYRKGARQYRVHDSGIRQDNRKDRRYRHMSSR